MQNDTLTIEDILEARRLLDEADPPKIILIPRPLFEKYNWGPEGPPNYFRPTDTLPEIYEVDAKVWRDMVDFHRPAPFPMKKEPTDAD